MKKVKGQHATPTHIVTHRKKVRQWHSLGEVICVFRNKIAKAGFSFPKEPQDDIAIVNDTARTEDTAERIVSTYCVIISKMFITPVLIRQ